MIKDLEYYEDILQREWILAATAQWLAEDPNSTHFLIVAPPGAGKTTVAEQLLKKQIVHASHFCKSLAIQSIDPLHFVNSIARQLSTIPGFDQTLLSSSSVNIHANIQVRENFGKVTGVNIEALTLNAPTAIEAFSRAIADPLRQILKEGSSDRVVFLVDGLDEALQYPGGATILDLLAKDWNLGAQVRFLLTSRPVDRVLNALGSVEAVFFHLTDYPENVNSDLELHVAHFLEQAPLTEEKLREISEGGLPSRLVAMSGGNFLVLNRLLNTLLNEDSLLLLSGTSRLQPIGIEEMYYRDLSSRGLSRDIERWRSLYRPVLGTLAVAQEALSRDSVVLYTEIGRQEVTDALHDLRQFLVPDEYRQGRYVLFHGSFAEFLTNEDSAKEFWIDSDAFHRTIAELFRHLPTNWYECDLYQLKYTVYHLHQAGLMEHVAKILSDPGYLDARVNRSDCRSLLDDLERYSKNDDFLDNLHEAFLASLETIVARPNLMLQQVYSYLKGSASQGEGWLDKARDTFARSPFRPQVWLRRGNRSPERTIREPISLLQAAHRSIDVLQPLEGQNRLVIYSTDGVSVRDEPSLAAFIGWEKAYFSGHTADQSALEIVDLSTGSTIKKYTFSPGRCLSVSPRGDAFVMASEGGKISLRNLETGKEMRSVQCSEEITAVSFLNDSHSVAIGFSSGSVALWDGKSTNVQQERRDVFKWPVRRFVCSAQGAEIAVVSRFDLKILDARDLSVLGTFVAEDTMDAVVYDQHRNRFLFSDTKLDLNYESTIRNANADGLKDIIAFDRYRVMALAMSGNGAWLIIGTNRGNVRLCKIGEDPSSGPIEPSTSLRASAADVTEIVALEDGNKFITADDAGRIWAWRISDFPAQESAYQSPIYNAIFVGEKSLVTFGADMHLRVWNVDDGKEERQEARIEFLLKDPEVPAKAIVLRDKSKIWKFPPSGSFTLMDPESKGVITIDPTRGKIEHFRDESAGIMSAAATADGQTLAFGVGRPSREIVVRRGGDAVMELEAGEDPATALAFSRDGKRLVSGGGLSNRTSLRLWDLTTEEVVSERSLVGEVQYLEFAPGDEGVLGVVSGQLYFWDPELNLLAEKADGNILCAELSPDGVHIVTGGEDGVVRLWTRTPLREVAVFVAAAAVCGVAFGPTGTSILACSVWPEPTVYRFSIET